ncbi:MAG: glycoside hydrolase family 3 N-terminal domain-containing protein, partial [Terriglobales bacterium]
MLKRIAFLVVVCLITVSSASEKDNYNPGGPTELTRDGEKWAQRTLKKLTRKEKVGQIIMIMGLAEFQNVENPAFVTMQESIKKYHLGGIIISVRVDGPLLLRNQPYEAAMITNRLQRESSLPLLFAADFERGLSMRLLATPFFPYAMAFGATHRPQYAEAFGEVVARESRAIGVHWNFFPVADVNSNPLNPIINTRSFG